MKEVRQIKQLKSQLKNAEADLSILELSISNIQKEYNQKLKSVEQLKNKISSLSKVNKDLKVTEHAIIRYLERVKGLDIEEIEKEILTDSLRNMVTNLGNTGTFPGNGFNLLIKDGTVITITT